MAGQAGILTLWGLAQCQEQVLVLAFWLVLMTRAACCFAG